MTIEKIKDWFLEENAGKLNDIRPNSLPIISIVLRPEEKALLDADIENTLRSFVVDLADKDIEESITKGVGNYKKMVLPGLGKFEFSTGGNNSMSVKWPM